ncbi:MAG: macro domain-containing protein [bacterium]
MKWTIESCELIVKQGDITEQTTDAVVNAANKDLAPGGGVAGAIHRAAGQELTDYCRDLERCNTGEAVITPGFDLNATHIIHTVGPIYDSHPDAEGALRESYWNSLALARGEGLDSISFPLLSTGAFGYPVEEASRVAIETIKKFIDEENQLSEIRMVLFGESDYEVFVDVTREILGTEASA